MGIISARSSRIPTLCQELLELDYEEHRQCDTSQWRYSRCERNARRTFR